MRRMNAVRRAAMNRLYRRQLVRDAGRAGNWRPERFVAAPGITYLEADGVRIPRSMRHMIDRSFLP